MNSAREVPTRPSTRGTPAVGREPARCQRRSPSPPTRARVRLIHPLVHPGSKANARCAAPVVGASPGRRGRSVRAAPPPSSLARSRPSRFVSVRRSPATVEPVGVSANACPWPDGVRSTPVSRGPRPPGPARPRRTLSALHRRESSRADGGRSGRASERAAETARSASFPTGA